MGHHKPTDACNLFVDEAWDIPGQLLALQNTIVFMRIVFLDNNDLLVCTP
jgi:hypothetical protein